MVSQLSPDSNDADNAGVDADELNHDDMGGSYSTTQQHAAQEVQWDLTGATQSEALRAGLHMIADGNEYALEQLLAELQNPDALSADVAKQFDNTMGTTRN